MLVEPLFAATAQPNGHAHVGPSGAGHYVHMVHNAIEYGGLEAIGEGFELLEALPYDEDHPQVADLWCQGIRLAARWSLRCAGSSAGMRW